MIDDEPPEPENVIPLFATPQPVEGAPKVKPRGFYGGGCYGDHSPMVDREKRTVTCSKCDELLDPFDVLAKVASRYEQYQRLGEERRLLARQVEALKLEEKRVKARTKSHRNKDAVAAVAAERAKDEARRLEIERRTDDARQALKRIDQLIGRQQRVKHVERRPDGNERDEAPHD